MPRNKISDITPPQRSIRNVSRSQTPRTDREPAEPAQDEVYAEEGDIPAPPPSWRNRGKNNFFSRYGIWIVAAVILILLVFVFSVVFSGSKIVVTPKQSNVTISGTFSAYREPEFGQLAFETMVLDQTLSEEVEATGTEEVEERATGTIIIYNNYSEKSQRLVTNTRFETPEGLIYRVHEPVVIPGKEGSTPGSVEVTVYADEPGSKYNISLTDFTIPGFKGSPQFEKMYARSKSAMRGGFTGERVTVGEGDLDRVTQTLEAKLREQLTQDVITNKPDDFYAFEDLLFFRFDRPVLKEGSAQGMGIVEVTGQVAAIIFNKQEFAQHIAEKTVAAYEGEPVKLDSISSIALSLETEDSFDPETNDEFNFKLSGTTKIIWLFDEGDLREDLRGQTKDALMTILPGYPGIDKAQVILRPFWKQEFPEKAEDIVVETKLAQ